MASQEACGDRTACSNPQLLADLGRARGIARQHSRRGTRLTVLRYRVQVVERCRACSAARVTEGPRQQRPLPLCRDARELAGANSATRQHTRPRAPPIITAMATKAAPALFKQLDASLKADGAELAAKVKVSGALGGLDGHLHE